MSNFGSSSLQGAEIFYWRKCTRLRRWSFQKVLISNLYTNFFATAGRGYVCQLCVYWSPPPAPSISGWVVYRCFKRSVYFTGKITLARSCQQNDCRENKSTMHDSLTFFLHFQHLQDFETCQNLCRWWQWEHCVWLARNAGLAWFILTWFPRRHGDPTGLD